MSKYDSTFDEKQIALYNYDTMCDVSYFLLKNKMERFCISFDS